MKSTRIAPFDNKIDKRYDKKISFHPLTSNSDNTTASLPASLSPADKHINEDDCIKREKTISKTASCPTQVFPTTSEIILNKNHIINSKANSKRRLPSGRIRSLSIPPESTDTTRLDFFGIGDTTIYQRYSPPPPPSPPLNSTTGDCKRAKLEMLHENKVLNGDIKQMRDDIDRIAVCEKQKVSTKDIPKIENDKLGKEERLGLDSIQASSPMKCQCIII